ncbi:MAG TPA: T9SS type A sorting domain-containing protein [Paludibacter sp.]|nr:MAG: hypothetical protein BWY08_01696 [Bacteroidetes bacterium ADurb.Bin174]HQB27704.1 T9SS type A sorting domain-containing protein [Paludibacter sp.]
MKTNLRNKTMFALLMAFGIITGVVAAGSVIETTVFSDNFNRVDISPGGSPEVTYTTTVTGTAVPIIQDGDLLRLPNVSDENARSQVMAGLADYNSPFNSKLNSIEADSLVWRFNIRQNYNGRLTGIDDASSRGIGVVLVASSSDLSVANGYAIINGGASPIDYRLVKFSNGLTNGDNITILQHGQTLTDNRVYMSVKLVYLPSSNTWKLYDRIDGPASGGSFSEPLTNTGYVLAGSVVDNTHTSSDMSCFGFTHKYSGKTTFNFWVDNFSVKTYETDMSVGISVNKNQSSVNWNYIHGGIQITAPAALLTLYDLTGSVVKSVQVKNQADIHIANPGIYVMKVQSPNGETSIEKILVK